MACATDRPVMQAITGDRGAASLLLLIQSYPLPQAIPSAHTSRDWRARPVMYRNGDRPGRITREATSRSGFEGGAGMAMRGRAGFRLAAGVLALSSVILGGGK